LVKKNFFFGFKFFKILFTLNDLSLLSKNEYATPVFQQATTNENEIIFLSDSIAIISFFFILKILNIFINFSENLFTSSYV